MEEVEIWRLHISPDAKDGMDPKKFCFDNGILGVGWPINDLIDPSDKDAYIESGKKLYGEHSNSWWRAINAVMNRMRRNHLCWTRDEVGNYYLGRITGDWQYVADQKHKQADICNIRQCHWIKVGANDAVPGKVCNSFISRSTVQRVLDDSVCLYSQYLFNQEVKGSYDLNNHELDLFSLVSTDDCEDLVGAFLQEEGYRLIPSSCKRSTVGYEFVLKHSKTGIRAVAQVKQGQSNLCYQDYSTLDCEVFLFTTSGQYTGSPIQGVHSIDKVKLMDFVKNRREILSDRINVWLKIIEPVNT